MYTHEELITHLIKAGYLHTPLLIDAFRKIDRRDFVAEAYRDDAYSDEALPIGHGQTISQPLTVAFMLELLQPQPGERILDIGSGSGWKAALLAHIVSQESGNPKSETLNSSAQGGSVLGGKQTQNPKSKIQNGRVISIERIKELKEMAERNIAKYNFIEKGMIKVVLGDGSEGAPESLIPKDGFDKIIAGAAAEQVIPGAWKAQLKVGGKIVAPVDWSVWVYVKMGENEFEEKEYRGFRFVPLIKEE